ncbi:MAG TPA: YfiR family protein [Vicinamibacterales bacterium]|nr:YfiR family protein [Vicinamibacterales bacterium]
MSGDLGEVSLEGTGRSTARAVEGLRTGFTAARPILTCFLIVWMFVSAAVPTPAAQHIADEYRVKAAFVFRFPQFVEWPPASLAGRKSLDLCVLGPNPFGKVLDELVQGETLDGRTLLVRHLTAGAAATGCHVLYLADGPATPRRPILQRVATAPVLTISDAPAFLDEGGIIQLRVVGNRVRFDINAEAARQAGLRLSSQVLRLAITVRGGPS